MYYGSKMKVDFYNWRDKEELIWLIVFKNTGRYSLSKRLAITHSNRLSQKDWQHLPGNSLKKTDDYSLKGMSFSIYLA